MFGLFILLKTEGLLLQIRGKPMQVANTQLTNESEMSRLERLRTQFAQLALSARQLEISDKVLLAALGNYLKE